MRHFVRRGVTLTDVLVVLVVMMFFAALVMQHRVFAGERSNRIKCMSNLSQIGKGLLLYSTDNQNKGAYPRGNADPSSSNLMLPGSTDGAAFPNGSLPEGKSFAPSAVNDVGVAIFMLLKQGEFNAQAFVCPTSNQEPDTLNSQPLSSRTSFTSNKNLSYSFTNPYPAIKAIQRGYKWSGNVQNAEFALAADRNDGGGDPTQVNPGSPGKLQVTLNSSNHNRAGQNVLYADGHVEWQITSFCGASKDCIYAPAAVNEPNSELGTGYTQKSPAAAVAYGDMQPQMDLDSVMVPWAGGGFPTGPAQSVLRDGNMMLILVGVAVAVIGGVVLMVVLLKKKGPAAPSPMVPPPPPVAPV